MSHRRDGSGQMPGWLNAVLICGTVAVVAAMEFRRPLRKDKDDKLRRNTRNAAFAALAAATVAVAEKPVVGPLALQVQSKRLGLLKLFGLPAWAEVALSVLLLDYTLFIWHVLTHKVPLLWRFHRPHHVDLDLDASTALRFHFGELILSVPWRAAQVRLIGVSPFGLALWQTLTLMEILFHHSNLRLPHRVEQRLCRIIVTPRMHGIHHSVVREERDSNWSTIFSWPDYLHGTIRLNVLQDSVDIGVAGCQDPKQLTLGRVLAMPFTPQPEVEGPKREALPVPPTVLAV
ncbi:sterol desaturase family protein [Geomonas anaerohicana]|uniref:Sterol desaturase family protein n=1 Tax=Geomonas anaerohicana TaxID=2798583 RepID=A0ABS0YHX5_9BACT|nr:sterol desaturase family protein [Geomonas anaerohicana]MBJ6751895.1 sterol desaturase family protein [Geomonas anaerohicana]